MSTAISSPASATGPRKGPRFPPAAAGIQVNHCKNPKCANFGVPPKLETKRGRAATRAAAVGPGDYTVVATGRDLPALKCRLCSEIFPMQSNLAIAEELMRIADYLDPVLPRCPNESCALSNAAPDVKHFTRFGTNAHGTPRFKCVGCGKAFAAIFGGRSTKRQRNTHRNRDIFQHLMNAMPLRRIIKVLGISPSILYDRIDFLHTQCNMFSGERERTLLERDDLGTRYLSVDRQKLVVNWHTKKVRKNTIVASIAPPPTRGPDMSSGSTSTSTRGWTRLRLQKDMLRFGDPGLLPEAFRRYARVWLPADWDAAAVRAATRDGGRRALNAAEKSRRLEALVEGAYDAANEREDIEAGDGPGESSRTPVNGMLLHEQVVMHAHIQLVSRLLQRAKKIRFFADQESGIRAAILAAVPGRVLNRTADAFYVKVLKDFTVDQKRVMVGNSKRRLAQVAADHGINEEAAELLVAQEEMARMATIGKWGDRWFRHPISDMREPEKLVCWLTDIDPPESDAMKLKHQRDHHALLHLKGTVTAVDRFFMQVRRGLTLAERGIVSASAERRLWFGKNAYNPGVLVKVLSIFRTYFNYCEVGQDGKTPAMRLGLAKGPIAPEDIVYFSPEQPARRRAPTAR